MGLSVSTSQWLNPFNASCSKLLLFESFSAIFNFWHSGALTLSGECQSARMSKIITGGLDQDGKVKALTESAEKWLTTAHKSVNSLTALAPVPENIRPTCYVKILSSFCLTLSQDGHRAYWCSTVPQKWSSLIKVTAWIYGDMGVDPQKKVDGTPPLLLELCPLNPAGCLGSAVSYRSRSAKIEFGAF